MQHFGLEDRVRPESHIGGMPELNKGYHVIACFRIKKKLGFGLKCSEVEIVHISMICM